MYKRQLLFSKKTGVKMTIRVDIEAESAAGFDEGTQRAARENCKELKFKSSDFEGGG